MKLKDSEYKDLCDKHTREVIDAKIQDLHDHVESKGAKYKSYAATLRVWLKRDQHVGNGVKNPPSSGSPPTERDNIKRNMEIFEEFRKLDSEAGLPAKIRLNGDYVVSLANNGDSIGLDISPATFFNVLSNWCRHSR